MATILAVVVALTLAGCAAPRASSPSALMPHGATFMGPLLLNDDEFWTNPARTRQAIQDPYMSDKREVLLFDAPAVVDLDARQTLPTQALRVARFATLSQRPFRASAIVVAVDESDDTVRADRAVAPPTRETDPNTPGYSGPPVEGMGSEVFTIDLRKRLELPWRAGRHFASLIVWDQLTETRAIEFVQKGPVQPAVETPAPKLFPDPGPDFAAFRKVQGSPALPPDEGIALSAPRALDRSRPDACVLLGAFRLPAPRRHVAPRGGASAPTAVVAITLLATGSSIADPKLWRLNVASFDPVDPADPRPVVTGYFSVDLRALDGFAAREQTVFLYAFSNRASAGPASIKID